MGKIEQEIIENMLTDELIDAAIGYMNAASITTNKENYERVKRHRRRVESMAHVLFNRDHIILNYHFTTNGKNNLEPRYVRKK